MFQYSVRYCLLHNGGLGLTAMEKLYLGSHLSEPTPIVSTSDSASMSPGPLDFTCGVLCGQRIQCTFPWEAHPVVLPLHPGFLTHHNILQSICVGPNGEVSLFLSTEQYSTVYIFFIRIPINRHLD